MVRYQQLRPYRHKPPNIVNHAVKFVFRQLPPLWQNIFQAQTATLPEQQQSTFFQNRSDWVHA